MMLHETLEWFSGQAVDISTAKTRPPRAPLPLLALPPTFSSVEKKNCQLFPSARTPQNPRKPLEKNHVNGRSRLPTRWLCG
jgi:hypothetical protein